MKRSGFTLIEVMVVLSILAIIAILSYNFFGSTIKEASNKSMAIQIVKDLQMVSNALEHYMLDTGSDMPVGTLYSTNTLYTTYLEPYIKSGPEPPSASYHVGCESNHQYSLTPRGWNIPDSNTAALDSYVAADCISDDVCKAINSIYAPSIGDAIWDSVGITTFPLPEEKIYCAQISATRNSVTVLIENN